MLCEKKIHGQDVDITWSNDLVEYDYFIRQSILLEFLYNNFNFDYTFLKLFHFLIYILHFNKIIYLELKKLIK